MSTIPRIPLATRIAGTAKSSLSSDIRLPAPQKPLAGRQSKRKQFMLCLHNAPPRLACLELSRATPVVPSRKVFPADSFMSVVGARALLAKLRARKPPSPRFDGQGIPAPTRLLQLQLPMPLLRL